MPISPTGFGTDPRAAAEIWDALTLWMLGRIDEALPLAERALADAESAAHAPTMAIALSYAAVLGLLRRTPKPSRATVKRRPMSCLDTISQLFLLAPGIPSRLGEVVRRCRRVEPRDAAARETRRI